MNAGSYRFKLNWSSLWHLWQGWTRFRLAEGISILRLVLILDVSKWQGVINFVVMLREGVKGVIVKCGQGMLEDVQFSTSWLRAKQAGLPRGTYWFFDSRIDPKLQAAHWWNWIKHDRGELMHFVDYEENYLGQWKGWRNLKIFIQEFQRLSGLPSAQIGIYTGYYYWIANSPTNLAELNWFAQFPLWLAWYTDNPANVKIPKPWTTLILWQYGTPPNGEKYGAESIEIDENNFNGDEAAYRERFSLGGAIPPPIGGSMNYRVVWPNGVARRSAASTSNSGTGFEKYPFDAVVEVVEENIPDLGAPNDPNKKWVKFADGLYGASNYPDNSGIPQVRMVKVTEPNPEPEPPAKLPFMFEAEGFKPFSGELERE